MAGASFEDLKQEVAMKAEESGTLPSSVTVNGTQYTLQMPVETKMRAIQVVRDPARLDHLLDGVTFVGVDGSEVHA
ncbi:MAG: hypothetical protein M3008_09295 [Chloroflexota bacterium]|nr:hypothetical protein [Chloroflexota bacterium]